MEEKEKMGKRINERERKRERAKKEKRTRSYAIACVRLNPGYPFSKIESHSLPFYERIRELTEALARANNR